MIDRLAIAVIAGAALFVAWAVPAPFLLCTMAGSVVLVARYRQTGCKDLALAAIILPLFCLVRGPLLMPLTALTPHTVDAALLRLDFGAGAWWFAVTWAHPWLHQVLRVAYYDALPLWICVVIAYSAEPMEALKRNVLAVFAGVPICLLFPAVGPVWIHTSTAPRNCMPSLHFTWALLAWWYSGGRMRWPSAVLVVLTALATIGLGEHYIIDLVAAIPFTAAVLMIPLYKLRSPRIGLAQLGGENAPDYRYRSN